MRYITVSAMLMAYAVSMFSGGVMALGIMSVFHTAIPVQLTAAVICVGSAACLISRQAFLSYRQLLVDVTGSE